MPDDMFRFVACSALDAYIPSFTVQSIGAAALGVDNAGLGVGF